MCFFFLDHFIFYSLYLIYSKNIFKKKLIHFPFFYYDLGDAAEKHNVRCNDIYCTEILSE